MAQFDVYRNPNPDSRKRFPLLVDIQNPVIDRIATRIVIPLSPTQDSSLKSLVALTPLVTFEGTEYLLLTPQLSSIRTRLLKKPLGSLAHLRQEIISAIDFAITGI